MLDDVAGSDVEGITVVSAFTVVTGVEATVVETVVSAVSDGVVVDVLNSVVVEN